jgi:hypothetical protein
MPQYILWTKKYEKDFNNGIIDKTPVLGFINENGEIIVDENSQTYTYKYENNKLEIIENFRPLLFDELCLTKNNMAPYDAVKIGVYDENNKRIGHIDISDMQHPTGKRIYRVGLISDVHYNDNSGDIDDQVNTDSGSLFNTDLINAFDFFNNKNDVEFTCISGDITTDNETHEKAYIEMRDKNSADTPVYACRGNHDNAVFYNSNQNLELWNNIACPNEIYDTYYFDKNDPLNIYSKNSTDKSSFYFIRPIKKYFKGLENNDDIYIFLSVDYNGPGSRGNYSEIIDDTQYYSQEQLKWFMLIMDKYRNNRCFVFTHLFFPLKAGNNTSGNYYEYARGRGSYVLAGKNFEVLNFINNKYLNSIWFTGHSHYKWMWAKIDKKISVCNYDSLNECESAWNVHLPSLARPLAISDGYQVNYDESEGAIMDIYNDYVDIRGIEFKTNEVTKYFGITNLAEQYINNSDKYIQLSDFNDTYNVTELQDNYIQIMFNDVYEYYITGEGYDNTYSTQTPVLYVEDVIVTDENGNDITSEALKTGKLGFRYQPNYLYSIHTDAPITFYNNYGNQGVLFKLSSDYPLSLNCSVKLKAKLKFITDVNYLNKYTPIGTYRLNTTIKEIESFGTSEDIVEFIENTNVKIKTYTMPLINEDQTLNITAYSGTPIIELLNNNGKLFVDVTFTEAAQKCTVTNDTVLNIQNLTGAKLNLSFVEYICEETLTDTAKEYVGFYKATDHKYTTENNVPLDVILLDNTNGCEFNCSSRYISDGGGVLPITIRMSGNIEFTYI